MVRNWSSVRVRQRDWADRVCLWALTVARPHGGAVPGSLWKPLGNPPGGCVASWGVLVIRAIPLVPEIIHARSGDGPDGRRRIGCKPAAGGRLKHRSSLRTAAAVASWMAGCGPRLGCLNGRCSTSIGKEPTNTREGVLSRLDRDQLAAARRAPARVSDAQRRRWPGRAGACSSPLAPWTRTCASRGAKACPSSAPRRMRSSVGTTAGDQRRPREVALGSPLDCA
jgi:hypothetical protein